MKLLLTGSIALDRIMLYNGRFSEVIKPEKLHVLSLSVLLDDLRETRGGVAANIAYTLALIGEKPILYGSVGTNAREYMESLSKMGVDTSKVHYSSLPTATFSVITDRSDCQVGGFYPGAMADSDMLSLDRFDAEEIFVVISPHDPKQMATQVKECAQRKRRMLYDVGQQVSNISSVDIRSGISAAELLIVNDYEMGVIEEKTGWALEEITKKLKTVVVTLGERGANVWANGVKKTTPAVTDGKVVDPTGAGDAFRAGFLYGYIRDVDPLICAELGSVAAAFSIESRGTQEHYFTRAQFRERFTKHFGPNPVLE